MGRTTPLAKDEGLESVLASEQSQKLSKEEVEAALTRLQALLTRLRQEWAEVIRQPRQDVQSVAYNPILERISESLGECASIKSRMDENYTDVVAIRLRMLAEVTMRNTRELHQSPQTKLAGERKYAQMLIDLNERLLLEIGEFI